MPIKNAIIADSVEIFHPDLVNLYGCKIGLNTKISAFAEIQKGVVIGDRCKISSHRFICEGVTIEDDVFIGHGVMFINDMEPRATTEDGALKGTDDWSAVETRVCWGASVGTGAVVLGGVTIGAGAVVTRNVEPDSTVAGVSARLLLSSSENVVLH